MRSLTALHLPGASPRRTPALAPALLLAALLSACGSGAPTPAPAAGGALTGGTLTLGVEAVPVTGALAQTGTLRVRGVAPATVRLNVKEAPAGTQLEAGLPVADGSDTLVPLLVGGQGRGAARLTVSAGGREQELSVAVLGSRTAALGSGPYLAGGARVQGTQVWLRAPASADAAARHSLRRFDPATGQATAVAFALSGFETITSHAVAGADVWVAARGVSADGSFLIRRGPDGQTRLYPAGTVETLGNLTPLPDGRVAFTAYGQERVLLLDPASGAVQTLVTEGVPGSLALGAGGLLFTRGGARPAVVRLDLAGGPARVYPVGTPEVSVPAALCAAPDGRAWFTETRTGTLWSLDPVSGEQRAVGLPAGARPGELALAPDGTLWATDTARGGLLRVLPGEDRAAALALPAGTPAASAGPRALTTGPDGTVWFETGGQLAGLK